MKKSLLICLGMAYLLNQKTLAQDTKWSYNFGNTALSLTTGGPNSSLFPATETNNSLSGGTALVNVGNTPTMGSVSIVMPQNEGDRKGGGTGGELKIVSSPTAGNISKFSIYDIEGATRLMAVKFNARFVGNNGTIMFALGNGNSFNDNAGVNVGACLALIRFNFGASDISILRYDHATTSYPSLPVTAGNTNKLNADQLYEFTVYANNLNTTQSYKKGEYTYNVAKNTFDIWVGNTLLTDDCPISGNISTNLSNAGSLLDSYMLLTHNTASSNATTYIDNIQYTNYFPMDDTVLPVTYAKELSGKILGQTVELNWATASEVDHAKFNILRSTKGSEFVKIGEVSGKGSSTYAFIDYNPEAGINYYQLEQVDTDGKSSKSKNISVKFSSKITGMYAQVNDGVFSYSVNTEWEGKAEVLVTDITGKIMLNKQNILNKNTFSFSEKINWKPGVYIAKLKLGDEVLMVKIINN